MQVCMEEEQRLVVFLPCRHAVVCEACTARMTQLDSKLKCPVCRELVQSKVLPHYA